MSDPGIGRAMRRIIVLGLAAGIGSPVAAGAQSTTEARQELDSLLPQWRAATARLADSAAARRRAADTRLVERGNLRILADAEIASRVAAAADVASASLDRVFGVEARRVADQTLVAHQNPARQGQTVRMIRVRWSASEASRRESPLGFPRDMERTVAWDPAGNSHEDLVAALEAVGASPLHSMLDEALRSWFGRSLPATDESSDELADIYVDLTTASTQITRRCLDGDLVGCRQVLDLAPVADPVLEAFTVTQRRSLVAGNSDLLRTRERAGEFDRCVVGLDDVACVSRLRELSIERLSRSLSTTAARRSFARWALARGGAGAYSRLRETKDRPIEERFATAAGMPADSLIASWRAHVMTAQPPSSTIPPATAFATLLWIGACGALSLRSSRWR